MAGRSALLYVVLVACGGGGAGPSDSSLHAIDGDVDSGGDAGSGVCETAASYPMTTLGSGAQRATQSGSGITGDESHDLEYIGKLDSNALPAELVIELAAGIGTFAGADFGPKSIPLAGAELDYKTCGACVRVLAEVGSDGSASQDYMATGGTLDVTQTAGTFAATLTDVTLTHVDIGSDFDSIPVGDCDIAIPSLAVTAPVQAAALRPRRP